MPRVGVLGAFSIDNPGDALLGLASRRAVAEYVPDAEVVLMAPDWPRDDVFRQAWDERRGLGVPIRRIAPGDTAWHDDLDALVVGGGGLLLPCSPTCRPFFLDGPDHWFPAAKAAAWNGVGAQNTPWYVGRLGDGDDVAGLVRGCCERLAYVSVRDRTTAKLIAASGFDGPVRVVPDPAFLLDPVDADAGREILAAHGVDPDRRVLGLTLGPSLMDRRTAFFYEELFAAIEAAASAVAAEIVLLPFGGIAAGALLQRQAAARLAAATIVDADLDALQCCSLIAAMDLYVASRLHAMIAALAHDVPFAVIDEYLDASTASSKVREVVVDLDLEPHYLNPYLPGSPRAKLESIGDRAQRGQVGFRASLEPLRARLRRHYGEMFEALGLR